MQAIGSGWDVVGRVALTLMAYQGFDRVDNVLPDRTDRTWLVGTGVGRRFGADVRIGVDVNYVTRVSDAPFRTTRE